MTNCALQTFRRSSVLTLCALASLFLVACGGGGESGTESSRLDSTVPFSEKSPSGEASDSQSTNESQESEPTSSPEPDTSEPEQTVSDGEESNTDSTADADKGSDQVADSEPTNSGNTNDELTDSGSTDDGSTSGEDLLDPVEEASDELAAEVDGAVTLEWYRPQYRENGDIIRDGEIGGYEVRYRQVGSQETQSVVLDGEWELEYELDGLEAGEYEFSIAAYDNNGLYSEFVSISPL